MGGQDGRQRQLGVGAAVCEKQGRYQWVAKEGGGSGLKRGLKRELKRGRQRAGGGSGLYLF